MLGVRTVFLVLFFLAGGVWADRIPRQRLMMLSDLGRAATQGLLGVLLVSGVVELWHFLVIEGVNGAFSAFFFPAATGLTPKTVSPARLQQANALLSLTYSSAAIIGPAIAGVLVATIGPGTALIVDAVTFLVSAFLLLQIRLPESARFIEATTFLSDLAAGWTEVRSRSWVWISILNFSHFQLIALPAFFVLGPFIADTSLGGASAWATILAAAGVGSVVGDLAAMRIEPKRPLRTAYRSMLLATPVLIAFGLEAPLAVIAGAAFFWGVSMTFFNTYWFTMIQEHIPDASLSKVSSYDWMGSTALRPLGFALIAPLSEVIGVTQTFLGIAAIVATVELITASLPSIASLERAYSHEVSASEVIEPSAGTVGAQPPSLG